VSELHKFLFDGLPVRGMLVRLTDAWSEILARRAGNTATGPYPEPVRALLGEMAAAAVLMEANIKFNGALVLQVFGDGPIKLAVAEVQPDLSLRATATVLGEVPEDARLSQMVNLHGGGRCAITLDPKTAFRASSLTKAWCRCTATSTKSSNACPTCCSTTCCSPSSSIPCWCWRPTTRWPQAC
jgi:redox-regulated HSP33 family molecular chaperone